MTLIKDAAIVAATISVPKNQLEKQRIEEEKTKRLQDFRKGEGKDMYDAQRFLKEALMEQKEIVPSTTTKPKKSKSKSTKEKSKKEGKSKKISYQKK